MDAQLELEILPQPDDVTCGATCLHALYRYYDRELPLDRIIREVRQLEGGGTLAVLLANHALRHGFRARIYTFNLQVFDPTWFELPASALPHRLQLQWDTKPDPKLRTAIRAYQEYLELGGELRMEDLTPALIRRYLKRGQPLLTGLSSTFLYREAREIGASNTADDIRGEPAGHFVVLTGYDSEQRSVFLADPWEENPLTRSRHYQVGIDRVVNAMLLGVLTFDANFLLIDPLPGAH